MLLMHCIVKAVHPIGKSWRWFGPALEPAAAGLRATVGRHLVLAARLVTYVRLMQWYCIKS